MTAREPGPEDATVTRMLQEWSRGDPEAMDDVVAMVVDQLRQTARSLMRRESVDHTLQPTALVHELYIRLRGRRTVSWHNRTHFLRFAAETMRRILIDHTRTRTRAKRGTGQRTVALDEILAAAPGPALEPADLLALDAALERLARLDPRQCQVVELRFFLGLSMEQVAETLEIGLATAYRDWAAARAWLFRELARQRAAVQLPAPEASDR